MRCYLSFCLYFCRYCSSDCWWVGVTTSAVSANQQRCWRSPAHIKSAAQKQWIRCRWWQWQRFSWSVWRFLRAKHSGQPREHRPASGASVRAGSSASDPAGERDTGGPRSSLHAGVWSAALDREETEVRAQRPLLTHDNHISTKQLTWFLFMSW